MQEADSPRFYRLTEYITTVVFPLKYSRRKVEQGGSFFPSPWQEESSIVVRLSSTYVVVERTAEMIRNETRRGAAEKSQTCLHPSSMLFQAHGKIKAVLVASCMATAHVSVPHFLLPLSRTGDSSGPCMR